MSTKILIANRAEISLRGTAYFDANAHA